jgi:hypothetical protein
VYQAIINEIPPHDFYFEGFLGSGAVLRHKRPAAHNYGIDLDPRALALWQGDEVPGLELISGDAVKFLAALRWTQDRARRTVCYLDPPYLATTRKSARRIYRYEFMTEAEHVRLLKVCLALPCYVILSGYDSPLYRRTLRTWRRVSIPTVNRAGERVTEMLWLNYPKPFELHDYNFLGSNRTQRQIYKRQQERWRRRLLDMDALKRAALLRAIDELRSTAAAKGYGGSR